MSWQSFLQPCTHPADGAAVDRAAASALGLQTIVSIPVDVGGQITDVIEVASRQTASKQVA